MKKTVHQLFYIILFLSVSLTFSYAQGFNLSVSEVEQEFLVDLSDPGAIEEMYVDVSNTSTTDTLFLRWNRVPVVAPENWETQICDNNRCYTPIVYSNIAEDLALFEPMVLPPDSTYTMIFYIIPNGQEGTGNYHLDFSTVNNPDSIIGSVSFLANVKSGTTNTYSPEELEDVFIYPNPVVNEFRISNDTKVDQVEIRNMLGQRVKLFKSYTGASYEVYDLPQGVYLVRLLDRDNDTIKTMRMSKYSFRP